MKTKEPKPNEKERAEALASWRSKNWRKVLKDNMKVLEVIRDDMEAKDSDRIDAAKTLARMADILSPEKTIQVQNKPKKDGEGWWEQELPPEELSEIDAIINHHPIK